MLKANKSAAIVNGVYVVIAVLAMVEYQVIRGMFTSWIAMLAVAVAGLVNLVLIIREKDLRSALLCALSMAGIIGAYIPHLYL
ncbi:MAG: hypothetical protein EOM52_06905 [Clostridia bacterium]|nr:hypothetical protein [Clostridia bacterium]